MEKKMDLDSFGEIIDRILEENEFQMLLTMPEGTQEVQIKDNMELGSAVQFFCHVERHRNYHQDDADRGGAGHCDTRLGTNSGRSACYG